MVFLVDTGVLLRLFNRADPAQPSIRQCLREQRKAGHLLVVAPQNLAEFWNVSTRPESARGGYGLSVAETERCVRAIENICGILPESPGAYLIWRRLVLDLEIKGVQVHDARLVALMKAHSIANIITMNAVDFTRYSGILILTPGSPATKTI